MVHRSGEAVCLVRTGTTPVAGIIPERGRRCLTLRGEAGTADANRAGCMQACVSCIQIFVLLRIDRIRRGIKDGLIPHEPPCSQQEAQWPSEPVETHGPVVPGSLWCREQTEEGGTHPRRKGVCAPPFRFPFHPASRHSGSGQGDFRLFLPPPRDRASESPHQRCLCVVRCVFCDLCYSRRRTGHA